ncbi:hypothetical protein ACFFUE_10330 [Bergeyella porcorum]|uniref:hypothetical protein n=1 Tax=Bergeyella porcorum TaxID=1735111 RepID=UPI0035E4E30C
MEVLFADNYQFFTHISVLFAHILVQKAPSEVQNAGLAMLNAHILVQNAPPKVQNAGFYPRFT